MNAGPALAVGLALAACVVSAASQPVTSVTQQVRVFRGGTELVPVDVRVLDATGQPVTGLTRADFRVFEDDVERPIEQFGVVSLPVDRAAGSSDPGPAASDEPRADRRTFLIVLGRGRHGGPVHVLPAIAQFLRERLLPRDEVAVIGYNRATPFTTDHAAIAAVVDRYRRDHGRIEALLEQHQNILPGVSRPEDLPPAVQQRIDAVFGRDALALDVSARAPDPPAPSFDETPADVSFDEFINQAYANLTDLTNVQMGLDYLRFVDGEKHLLLVTTGGLGLRDARDEAQLASLAADARVTLETIHTGGMVGAPQAGGSGPIAAVPTPAQVFQQTFAVRGLRGMAEWTGGQAWAFARGEDALAALDRSTRHRYVLGYVPAGTGPASRFRRIRVEVTRPGVTVHHRHGYYASTTERDTDFAEVRALARVRQAGGFAAVATDLDVRLDAAVETRAEGAREVVATVTIDPARFDFRTLDGMRLGIVDIAVFVGNERRQVIAETWHRREWTLSEDGFTALRAAPIRETVRVPVAAEPAVVKVAVYDRGSNRLGTATVTVPPRR